MSHARNARTIVITVRSHLILTSSQTNLFHRPINTKWFSHISKSDSDSDTDSRLSVNKQHDRVAPDVKVERDGITKDTIRLIPIVIPKTVGRGGNIIFREVDTGNIKLTGTHHRSTFGNILKKVSYFLSHFYRKLNVMEPSAGPDADIASISESSHDNGANSQSLGPPESVQGMKILDVDAFKKIVCVPGLRVPNSHIGSVSKKLKSMLLKIIAIKPIAEVDVNDPEYNTHKIILLDPQKINGLQSFKEENEKFFASCDISMDTVKSYELPLSYENWTHHEILRAIIPEEFAGVAGYSAIGHILHVNLREGMQDYKSIIGRVLLDKIPVGKTVVNKLDMIDNTFRNFEMEVLAGDDDLITVTKEHGITFKLDFSKVYWNPRLATEHQRIVTSLVRSDVVFDVFAGIGPFAVPAAKKGCTVYANDLNPHSYHWMKENMILNKVKGEYHTYNLDGRQFITTIVKDQLLHHWQQELRSSKEQYRILMNLPAIAVQFLDVFPGLLRDHSHKECVSWPSYHEPRVYCYAFTKAEDGMYDVVEQAQTHLGSKLGTDHEVRFVRNVAPNKDMFCVMFNLTAELLFSQAEGVEPPLKKQKAEMDAS